MKHVLLFLFILCSVPPLAGQTRPIAPEPSETKYVIPDGEFTLDEERLIFRGDTLYREPLVGSHEVHGYDSMQNEVEGGSLAIVDYRSTEGIYIEIVEGFHTEKFKRFQVVIPRK